MSQRIVINLDSLFNQQAKLAELQEYKQKVLAMAIDGNDIVLTGRAPVWLYLIIAHVLHGKAKRLFYDSPVTGKVEIFNHDPF